MDSTFIKESKKILVGGARMKRIKKWLVLLFSLFLVFEYVNYIQQNQTVLLIFNSLLILVISFYGRVFSTLNLKKIFVLFSLFVLVTISYLLIESDYYRNIFIGTYVCISGVLALMIKTARENIIFYYWIVFCKLLQVQIGGTVIIYSLECKYDSFFSHGSLFFGGSILFLFIVYTLITFIVLRNQERLFLSEEENMVNGEKLDLNEINNLDKLEAFFKDSERYLDIQFSFDDLSNELEISKDDLSKLIHKVYRVNFYKYIAYKRIKIAVDRLTNLDKKSTIESVMIESGFSSKPTFNKYFKEITGVTPSKFINR